MVVSECLFQVDWVVVWQEDLVSHSEGNVCGAFGIGVNAIWEDGLEVSKEAELMVEINEF